MKIKVSILLIATTLLQSNIALAANSLGCLIEPDEIASVGSQVIGVTDAVMVERGDFVHKGQVLATLKSDIERASVDVARTRSQLEADIRSAQANLNLARLTEKRGEILVERKFLSQQALDKSRTETQLAEQKLVFAREQLRVSSGELNLAKAQLGMRAIRSPIDGIVSDRFIWPGERVEEKPLFKIVKTNPLRVEVVAPITLFGKVKNDDLITVVPDLPGGNSIVAKVVLVDKLIDGASNTFRIRAEIANPDLKIPSGLRCKASITEEIKSVANDNVQQPSQHQNTLGAASQPSTPAKMPAKAEAVEPASNTSTHLIAISLPAKQALIKLNPQTQIGKVRRVAFRYVDNNVVNSLPVQQTHTGQNFLEVRYQTTVIVPSYSANNATSNKQAAVATTQKNLVQPLVVKVPLAATPIKPVASAKIAMATPTIAPVPYKPALALDHHLSAKITPMDAQVMRQFVSNSSNYY